MDTIVSGQKIHKTSLAGVYTLERPADGLPFIFDSPHSGQQIPKDFDYACSTDDLMKSEDRFVDELFEAAPRYGAGLLKAEFPRTYIDVNRRMDDIDPETYAGDWPVGEEGYVTPDPSNRSYAGIGLIRRLIRPGTPVYNHYLTPTIIQQRIDRYYIPYYEALETAMNELHYQFGQVLHVNCHSMPAHSVRGVKSDRANPSKPIDFVLGNRDGTTCDPRIVRNIQEFLSSIGYNVTINDPYKGVELINRFSNPAQGRHSLQIEINKSLYMDEKTGKKNKNFDKFKNDINGLIEFLQKEIESSLHSLAAD